jgi:mRNA interferase MazF
MDYKRGDVVYIPFQYSELTGGKTRPAVVVSSSHYHAQQGLYIVAAITSNTGAVGQGCLIADLAMAGLPALSLVRPVLLTLASTVMGRRVGRLAPTDLAQVSALLKTALGL